KGVSIFRIIQRFLKELNPDIVYLNSMFSYRFTIMPLLVLRLSGYKGKLVLAPRGMLREGARSFKRVKKTLFFIAFKALGFHKRIIFHATDDQEMKDIDAMFRGANRMIVPNVPDLGIEFVDTTPKREGHLHLFFLSR